MAAECRQLETEATVQLVAVLLQQTSEFHFVSLFLLVFPSTTSWQRTDTAHISLSFRKCRMSKAFCELVTQVFGLVFNFIQNCFSLHAAYIHHWGERKKKANSCKQHLVSKSSLCKNSQQPVVARVCYLQRVDCLAEIWEYIIKITLWHWSLTASIFWCNLSSCFSRPDIC